MSYEFSEFQALADKVEILTSDLKQAKETIQLLNNGRSMGEIIGLHTAENALREVEKLRKELEDLRKIHPLYCSFCGRIESEAQFLIEGSPNIIICDICVSRCNDIIKEEMDKLKKREIS